MSKIRIKNFGPIREGFKDDDGNEWLDIKKVTLFIGNQGSGKSTVAKLISTFTWIEKALNRGDLRLSQGNHIIERIEWQRLKSYLSDNSEIEYIGNRYNISYKPTDDIPWPVVTMIIDSNSYFVPKIMYVPAERNFLSTIKNAFDVSGLPGPLAEFAEEFKKAQMNLNGIKLDLPFKKFAYEYDEFKDISYVIGSDYKIDLLDSSSGLQSLIPLYLVTRNLAMKVEVENDPSTAEVNANQSVRRDREISRIMLDKTLTSNDKNKQAEEVFAKYHNKCFFNIVEEPEQNLFPDSQMDSLNSLLKFNNINEHSKLIMTTHSPYLINYLTLAVKAFIVRQSVANQHKNADDKIGAIVPVESLVNPEDLAIYEIDETDGSIRKLKNYKGLPSDENYLNNSLAKSNELFAQLQEIEKGWL